MVLASFHRSLRRFTIKVSLFVLGASQAGCQNILSESGDTETPAAIVFQARMLMDEREYGKAIELLETLEAADLAERDIAILRASAYVGRCGMDFIGFVAELQSMNASTSLFQLFLSVMKSATSPADCLAAEDFVEAVAATGAARTQDENLFLAFVSFAKIGAVLAATGNADDDGDGVADVGFNACTELTRAEGAEIGTALAIAVDSLTNASTTLFGSSLTKLQSICSVIGGCETATANYSTADRDAIRTAVHDNDGALGLGTQDPDTDATKTCNAEGA